MSKPSAILSVENLSVRFGYVDALKSVNLDFYKQEIVALVGDNGAGKSTLIKVLAGLLSPTQGTIRIQGEPVNLTSVHDADVHGIASVFQNHEFCDNLDVTSNLFLGKEIHTKFPVIRDDEGMIIRARQALSTLRASIRVGQPISELSIGQRQTVAIARTLLNDPKLILLDEPTASLSVMQTAEVLTYLQQLRSQGRCIVMVCHDLPDVFAVSDRIIVLRQGRIVGQYRTSETNYEHIIAQIAGVADDETAPASSDSAWPSAVRVKRTLLNRSNAPK